MGKTALLKQIRNAYRGGTPLALLDCAHVEEPAEHGAGWNPVTGALAELAVQLSPRVLSAPPVQFPRLCLGLAAVTSIGWSQEDDERARRDLQRLAPVMATVDESKGMGTAWVSKVLATLASTVADGTAPMAGVLAEATVETVLEEVYGRYQRRTEGWYGTYRDAGGNGKLGLHRLAVDFRHGGPRRAAAERRLVGALVEDLRRAYTGLTRLGSRRGRPVLLLATARRRHAPLGRRLVEPLLRDRADGRRDQLVVIAASLQTDHEGLRHATRRRAARGRPPGALPARRRHHLRRARRGAHPLSTAHTRSLFDRYDPAGHAPADLPGAVHRLTGGPPARRGPAGPGGRARPRPHCAARSPPARCWT